jgi:hypothetical protein
MKFVWVNGRAPRGQSSCALCREPIEESYLRELATSGRLCYCDDRCYLGHRWLAIPAGKESAMAS